MRLLIAVKSCQKDLRDNVHQAIRETWGKDLPEGVDLLFFVGGAKPSFVLKSDERHVVAPDGYWELHPKMLAILEYALRENYDFVDLCDTDTYLVLSKLVCSGFDLYDYSGAPINPAHGIFGKTYPGFKSDPYKTFQPQFYPYFSGGHGTILSKRAAKIVVEAPRSDITSEDFIIGQILAPFINAGMLVAKELPDFAQYVIHADKSHGGPVAWHLNCGYYGSGQQYTQRIDVGDALRRKHKEIMG